MNLKTGDKLESKNTGTEYEVVSYEEGSSFVQVKCDSLGIGPRRAKVSDFWKVR